MSVRITPMSMSGSELRSRSLQTFTALTRPHLPPISSPKLLSQRTSLSTISLVYTNFWPISTINLWQRISWTPHLALILDYDAVHHTDYLHILEVYFDHDCSIIHTADALYCHKNTLSYKLNKIKELLDYDILTNENRTNIMLSFYILRLEKRSI